MCAHELVPYRQVTQLQAPLIKHTTPTVPSGELTQTAESVPIGVIPVDPFNSLQLSYIL